MRLSIPVMCTAALLAACDNDSTPNRAPTFADSTVTVSVTENTLTAGYTPQATDAPGQTLTYSIAGGADAALFELDVAGALVFLAAPDFEAPTDADGDNQYELTVDVADPAGLAASQAVVVAVENINEAPAIDSASSASIAENATGVVYQASATDPEADAVTFTLGTDADSALFTVTPDGVLSLATALDFEAPTDVDADGVYTAMLIASDGTASSPTFAVDVAITDVPFSVSNLTVAPGAEPRSAEFAWDADEQTPDFAEYVITVSDDGIAPATDTAVGLTATSGAAELPLGSTDFVNATFTVEARDAGGSVLASTASLALDNQLATEELIGYLKGAEPNVGDGFGERVAVSGDGSTIAITALGESSGSTTDPSDNSAPLSGAVFVFTKNGTDWEQQGYIKASSIDTADLFGSAVALSEDGSVLLVGARREDSAATRVNGDDSNNSQADSGAAYVYRRSAGVWTFDAYLKGPFSAGDLQTGRAVALSADGATAVVSAIIPTSANEKIRPNSNDAGVQRVAPPPADRRTSVFIYKYANGGWDFDEQFTLPYATESNTVYASLAVSADGNRIAVGAPGDDSDATTVDGDGSNTNRADSGSVYIYDFDPLDGWDSAAYLKAPNAGAGDRFGWSVDLSADGQYVVIGAPSEDSEPGMPGSDAFTDAGAAYVFEELATGWVYVDMLKPAQTRLGDYWGSSVAMSADTSVLAIGGEFEDSNGVGVQTDGASVGNANNSGAVALFRGDGGVWTYRRLLKASNTGEDDNFGRTLAISDDGETIVVGAPPEDGDSAGIDGADNDDMSTAGAAYLY
ncbi:MAG: hypothetical protein AAFZ58_02565 [Pseudomonadota bacterium]